MDFQKLFSFSSLLEFDSKLNGLIQDRGLLLDHGWGRGAFGVWGLGGKGSGRRGRRGQLGCCLALVTLSPGTRVGLCPCSGPGSGLAWLLQGLLPGSGLQGW